MTEVYCSDCKHIYLQSVDNLYGYTIPKCKKVTYTRKNAVRKYETMTECTIANGNNDCKQFEQKKTIFNFLKRSR